MKKITASCFGFCLLFLMLAPVAVHAQALGDVSAVGAAAGLPTTSLPVMIGNIIKVILGILGTVLLVIIMYAGYLYMTAGGDAEQIKKAKAWMTNAVIGLAIIVFSYSITAFIMNRLVGGMLAGGGGYIGGGAAPNSSLSGGAFGTVIQSHYPTPEQTNVARNSMVLVTFRAPISPASVVGEPSADFQCPSGLGAGAVCGSLKNSFQVYRCAEATMAECKEIPGDANLSVPGYAIVTEDHRTVMFNPYGDSTTQSMGSPDKDMPYIVRLTGGITLDGAAGKSIFSVASPEYRWRFQTGTITDNTPPTVKSVVPAKQAYPDKGNQKLDSDGFVFLNQVVIVNFSEPVMPPLTQTQTCGVGDSDNEVQLIGQVKVKAACATNHITGAWKVGVNGYRTVQFLSDTTCAEGEKNSCGESVFCLPENSEISGKIFAARAIQGCTGNPGTGIMDMAGNMLDGNGNGTCEGPDADNFDWKFNTGNKIDLTPPHITLLEPNNAAANLATDVVLGAKFSEELDPESVDQEVTLVGESFSAWVDPNMGQTADGTPDLTKIEINHGAFAPAVGDAAMKYTPIIRSMVKDSRQNCFSPSKDETSDCRNAEAGTSCCPDLTTFQLEKVGAETCGL